MSVVPALTREFSVVISLALPNIPAIGRATVHRRLWLLLPALGLYGVDITVTLTGQSTAYWSGNYQQATEHNPFAHWLLSYDPRFFEIAAIVWATMFSTLVLVWRHWLSNTLAILLTIGHALGGSTWLARHGTIGWALAVVYLVVTAWLTRHCWQRAGFGQQVA